jgi:hypothetical protein
MTNRSDQEARAFSSVESFRRRKYEMANNDHTHVNFDAPASLRKWPSFKNERRTDGSGPYLIVDATLGECIREFMARPAATRHLYDIQTAAQPPLVSAILSEEIVVELSRLRDFL